MKIFTNSIGHTMITGSGCYGTITEYLEGVPEKFASNRLKRLETEGVTVSEVGWHIERLWERLRDLRSKRRIETARRIQRDMVWLES